MARGSCELGGFVVLVRLWFMGGGRLVRLVCV
jgi:hypothetical protein